MKFKGMILEVIYLDDRIATCLVKMCDVNQTLKVQFNTDNFIGEVGETYHMHVYFKVRDKVKNDRRIVDQVVRCKEMERVK